MHPFRKFIETFVSVNDEDWQLIINCFEERMISKGEIMLRKGQVCRHLYFLETGLVRYFIEKDGQSITKFFTVAPYCFTSQLSFTAEKPATENIQAIENSVVWQITLKQAEELLEIRSWNTFIRKVIQEVQFFTESILQEIQTATAEERYKKMLSENNTLIIRVPLIYLASYLGIAPQSLSRIRKKIAQKSRT